MINLKLEHRDCINIDIILWNYIDALEEECKRTKNNEEHTALLQTFIKQAKKISKSIQSQVNEQLYKDKFGEEE